MYLNAWVDACVIDVPLTRPRSGLTKGGLV